MLLLHVLFLHLGSGFVGVRLWFVNIYKLDLLLYVSDISFYKAIAEVFFSMSVIKKVKLKSFFFFK